MSANHHFSGINKEYKDIMEHNFGLRKYISLAYHSTIQDNLFLRAKFYQRPRADSSIYSNEGACSFLYIAPSYQAKTTFKTPGALKTDIHVDLGRFVKSLQTNIKLNATSSHLNGKVKFFWPHDMYKVKSAFNFGSQNIFRTKALCTLLKKPETELGVGLGLAFNFGERQLQLCRPSLWYYWEDNKLVVTYKKGKSKHSKGSLEAQLYNTLNPKTDVAIGTSYNFQKQSNNVSFGFRHRHSSNFTIKTRIDSNLDLRAAFDLMVTKNIHLVITSTYDLVEQHGGPETKQMIAGIRTPFSLKITFGDI